MRAIVPLRSDLILSAAQPRCLNVCAVSVAGSGGTFAKFGADLVRAREVFACAGVNLQQGGFMSVSDNTLLDMTGWTPKKTSAAAQPTRR